MCYTMCSLNLSAAAVSASGQHTTNSKVWSEHWPFIATSTPVGPHVWQQPAIVNSPGVPYSAAAPDQQPFLIRLKMDTLRL
jgi:hypothetical protein